jgi:hypothetical protein
MADVLAELPEEVITARADPSANRVRLTPPICTMGGDTHFTQFDVLATLGNGRHLMMGDDPRLPKMPAQPLPEQVSTRIVARGVFMTVL